MRITEILIEIHAKNVEKFQPRNMAHITKKLITSPGFAGVAKVSKVRPSWFISSPFRRFSAIPKQELRQKHMPIFEAFDRLSYS